MMRSTRPASEEAKTAAGEAETRHAIAAMGTVISIRASGRGTADAVREAASEIQRLDRRWSRFRPDSEVSRLNAAPGRWVTVGPDTEDMLVTAMRLREQACGAFDITAGSPAGPARQLQHAPGGLFRLAAGTRVDPGGIGKGCAAQRVVALLRGHGVTSALASFGQSSIGLLGRPAGRDAWRIGIRVPRRHTGRICRTLVVDSGFISTSGDYEASSVDGNHTVDPRVGRSAASGVRSATVVCDDGARAEVFSTALMVLGVEEGLRLHARVGGFEAVLIGADGVVTCTPGIDRSAGSAAYNLKT